MSIERPLATRTAGLALALLSLVATAPAPALPARLADSSLTSVDRDSTDGRVVQRSALAARRLTARIRLTAPVRVGRHDPVSVTGVVPTRQGSPRRAVTLKGVVDGRWQVLGRARAAADGSFRISVGRRVPARVRVRATAPSAGGLRAASGTRTIATRSAAQLQELRDRDTARDWTWLTAEEWQWSTCELTWSYDPAGGLDSMATVREAVARVDAASAMTFRQVPSGGSADVTIRWSTPRQDQTLRGSTAGYAAVRSTPSTAGEVEGIRSAVVHLDRTETGVPRRFARGRVTWGSITMHEVGHTLGLGHASGERQVMNGTPKASHWGNGDKAGLSAVSDHC